MELLGDSECLLSFLSLMRIDAIMYYIDRHRRYFYYYFYFPEIFIVVKMGRGDAMDYLVSLGKECISNPDRRQGCYII